MGAPAGNQNYLKGRRWKDAINRALEKRTTKAGGIEALDDLAEKLLSLGDQGDIAALKELGDRLDGKAAQSLDIGNKDGEAFTVIQRTIVDPRDSNT